MRGAGNPSPWLWAAVSCACLLAASVSADRAVHASDHRRYDEAAAAVPHGPSHENNQNRSLQQQQQQQQQVGTAMYSNANVGTGDVSGANADDSTVSSVTTIDLTSSGPPASAIDAAVNAVDLDAEETAVIDGGFDQDEAILADAAEELPADQVAEVDEGNVDDDDDEEDDEEDDEKEEEDDELVSCMDWIPTDPSTPPSSYAHCYDGTYEYALTSTSRPRRCSARHFNHGQYNYQQILAGNTAGSSPSDGWTVCARWFNLHAGLPTAFEDLSVPGLYPLVKIGNGGTYDLPACTGDCDSDDECQPGLFCLVRNRQSSSAVAFCGGRAEEKVDYCIPERYRDPNFARGDYMEELEEAIKGSVGVGVKDDDDDDGDGPPEVAQDGGMDSTDDTGEAVAPAEESVVQGDTSSEGTPPEDAEGVDEIVEDILTEEAVQEDSIAGNEPVVPVPTIVVDEPQEETWSPEVPTNDPGPAIEDTRGHEKEVMSHELAYDDPDDRPQKTFPIEVALPSFFMAIDVRVRKANKRQLQREDPDRIAEPVIDVDALRDALQSVLQTSIATLDDRLWGVTVQATNIDAVALTLENGRPANREYFSVQGQAIFLVLETGDGTEVTALDANPLPDEEQLRAAMELALQKNTLLEEFAEAKGRTKLPRAINVGASFMDGSPISGSYEDAEAEAGAIADGETIVSSIGSMSSDEEGSFFSTLTISAIAVAGGAIIFVIGGAAIYSRRRASRKSKEEDLSPRSRSFPQNEGNKLFTFGGDDSDPDAVKQTFSGDTHPISPTSSTKEEENKQKMEKYFEKLENVESQPEPSIDGESDFDLDASQYSESECGVTMSEWSVNDIGKDHVQLTDKQTLKPEKSIANMGKRMRQALGHKSTYAESEADMSYAETENMSALGDFRLGSVLGDDMSELGTNTIVEEVDGEYTPEKSNKAEFSALWKTRIENDESQMPPTVEDVSPAKSIEDSVLGVSLSETNRVIRRMKEENATNSFLDVSHHAPRFDIDNASTDSEAEDESLLFHTRPAPSMHSAAIPEVDGSNSDVGSSCKSAPSSTAKSAAGSIIGSILGNDDDNDEKKPEDNLDSLRYLDNSMTVDGSRKTSGDQIIDDDVSNAETSVDLDETADDILRGKYTNLLSEVASSAGTDDEPRFFQLDMPAAYRMDNVDAAGGVDDQSVGGSSMYSM